MLKNLKRELEERIATVIAELYEIDPEVVVGHAPRRELGDLATPAPLHLVGPLKRRKGSGPGPKPRDVATSIADRLELPELVDRVTVEGPGYLNFHLDRGAFARLLLAAPIVETPAGTREKVVVEHTNINPNKAAHIGHLRNAVLGDVLVRCLRALGYPTEVQNYIDDTGVQLADVVVGFADLRGLGVREVAALGEPFDHLCWDLYSEVGRWYDEDPQRKEMRRQTLHDLEAQRGERAEMGELIARRVVRRHLGTMARLGIGYDLITCESEILRLDFFAAAFEQLKACGAIQLEASGKNAGCWVMPLRDSEEFKGLEDPDKVIVRSDGTVTYVGKDIAYQLWKFGLLGSDFEYRFWESEGLWETGAREPGAAPAGEVPSFGKAHRVINVIDARQSYLQRIVRAGLQALGHTEEASRSVHFAYEMVALSAATAQQLGYDSEGQEGQGSLEMSGRKGIGVKADDLLQQLEIKSRDEIARRNRDLDSDELDRLAKEIATAALRFFMVKATTTRVIAFDFDEALNFEGESGPYLQYSLVRAQNIVRRLDEAGLSSTVGPQDLGASTSESWQDDLFDLLLSVAQIEEVVERATDGLELSLVARHAVDLAQKFHAIYHRHPILQEADTDVRNVRLATMLIFRRALGTLCELLGIPVPEKM